MPIQHDPLLTRALARELTEGWAGRRLRDLRLDRELRAGEIRFRDAPPLVLFLHPEDGQVVRGRSIGPGDAGFDLGRGRLARVVAPPDERLLAFHLAAPDGGSAPRIVAELHTNQWNLLLLGSPEEPSSAERRVRAALWAREAGGRSLRTGEPYRPPRGDRSWAGSPPTAEEWLELLESVPPEERRGRALRNVAWLSAVNVERVLGGALREAGRGPLLEAHGRYLELREAPDEPHLLERPWGLQPYVRSLGEPGAETVASLWDAMETSSRRSGRWDRLFPGAEPPGAEADRGEVVRERRELRAALEERLERLERRIGALERELREGADSGELRRRGNLLLARLEEVPRGMAEVELEGFDGRPVRVELDPRLEPAENAERCFEEASRRERAERRLPGEIGESRSTVERIEAALEALPDRGPDHEAWEEMWRLAGGRPAAEEDARDGTGRAAALPYRRLVSSGGLEIRIGKGARSNEDLTFHHSHTEDIWLHARQVPGAHVILRWGRKEENPPRRDLLEAAVAAAVHSDARHSGTVAVDWTRRKYVRSPRKSPPGVVIPREIQTLFVEPDEELLERLKPGGRA